MGGAIVGAQQEQRQPAVGAEQRIDAGRRRAVATARATPTAAGLGVGGSGGKVGAALGDAPTGERRQGSAAGAPRARPPTRAMTEDDREDEAADGEDPAARSHRLP